MSDLNWWKSLLLTWWGAFPATRFDFVAAIVLAWLIGWLCIRTWYRRKIEIGNQKLRLLESERDIERNQKEGLRGELHKLRPDFPILAMEIDYGDDEIKQFVQALAGGAKFSNIVELSKIPIPIDQAAIKTIAILSYTSTNGLSRTIKGPIFSTTAATPLAIEVVRWLPKK
jgi:hypothetical protein